MMNIKKYKVSVLVPVYRVEKYIGRCSKYLFEQTYENLEYIFVDDKSPDRSIEILLQILNNYPQRKPQVRIIHHKRNLGLACARNTAVNNATGDFVIHVDSDDYIDRDTITRCIVKQEENDSDIVSFGCYREYKSKTIVQIPPSFRNSKEMCLSMIEKKYHGKIINVGIWGRLIKRKLYVDYGIQTEPGINMAEDYQVITRLSYYAKRISTINNPLYHYNLQNTNSYVNTISPNLAYQSERSMQIVVDFFTNKEDEYREAVYSGLSNFLIRMTIDGIMGDFGKEFYKKNLSKWNSLPNKIRNNNPLLRRCIFLNYYIAKFYIKFIKNIKKII